MLRICALGTLITAFILVSLFTWHCFYYTDLSSAKNIVLLASIALSISEPFWPPLINEVLSFL
jgi:hypothetical protein